MTRSSKRRVRSKRESESSFAVIRVLWRKSEMRIMLELVCDQSMDGFKDGKLMYVRCLQLINIQWFLKKD